MIGWLLRRIPWLTTIQMVLLLSALSSFVAGLGSIVRGATTSVFLPAAILAVLLGWGLGPNRYKGWQVFGFVGLLGGLLLWGRTAQLGAPFLVLVASMPLYLLQSYYYSQGGPAQDRPGGP